MLLLRALSVRITTFWRVTLQNVLRSGTEDSHHQDERKWYQMDRQPELPR